MAYSLTWLPSVLRAAGLKVTEQPGWKARGHGDMGKVLGVLCHHTAGARKGNAPSLKIVTDGRPDLKGPLSQLVLGRDGTYYVVAAGLCYHAGPGNYRGIKSGNKSFIGIEAENTGLANDHPWPEVQMDAYVRGVAAMLKHIGADPIMAVGHLEYATPVGRKPDPSFSVGTRTARLKAMDAFRLRVAAVMRGPAERPAALSDVSEADDGAEPRAAEPVTLPDAAVTIDDVKIRTPAPAPTQTLVIGDPDIWNVQRRLKDMNYNPGGLDGRWGDMTASAISGFLNARPGDLAAPTSLAMFQQKRAEIEGELSRAETEGHTRSVSVERANASAKKVEEIAPEVVPVKRNFIMTVWAAVVTFVTGIANSLSGYVKDAWGFFTSHKDDLPSDPGILSTAWGYLGNVPALVWFVIAGCGIAFVAFNSWRGVKRITESVQTGERQ